MEMNAGPIPPTAEEAIEYRKSGEKITIVHEFDFWDAVEDAGRTPDE